MSYITIHQNYQHLTCMCGSIKGNINLRSFLKCAWFLSPASALRKGGMNSRLSVSHVTNNLTLAITFLCVQIGLSYLQDIPCDKTFNLQQDFWPSDLDIEAGTTILWICIFLFAHNLTNLIFNTPYILLFSLWISKDSLVHVSEYVFKQGTRDLTVNHVTIRIHPKVLK